MAKQEGIREGIREGMREILKDDFIVHGITHENPPPNKDCGEDCGVGIIDQIAAANPLCSPVRSGGSKHKKCVDCWNEYIDGLITRLLTKQASQGVALKVEGELPEDINTMQVGGYLNAQYDMKEAGYTLTAPLVKT